MATAEGLALTLLWKAAVPSLGYSDEILHK